jgi:YYY domain-containing protein
MKNTRLSHPWVYDLLLIVVLLVAAYLRLVGLNWDASQHLHPDERFLTMVETGISPVNGCKVTDLSLSDCPNLQKEWVSLSEYFNTNTSPLNPYNSGFGFFVYGTLPIFVIRYVAELLNQTGYDQVFLIGRQISALADLGTILLLYFIAARLYKRKVALLAAAFSALAVLQIQQSHFFTVDTFANFFIFLATYFAVRVQEEAFKWDPSEMPSVRTFARHPLFRWSLAFGLALGMAVASKLNAAPLAILLPAAFLIGALRPGSIVRRSTPEAFNHVLTLAIGFVLVGAIASAVSFRIFQPYAFNGPGLLGVRPNPNWIANIREQRGQANGDIDVPFALQWARRSHLFSFENVTKWGLGLPLGILAWIGFLWMGWRMLKGEWPKHALLWSWTAAYFLWQSLQFNPTMRYQLPIYPLLALMAAWAVFQFGKWTVGKSKSITINLKPLGWVVGVGVLLLTAAWAFAFVHIYQVPHTRVAATRWIYSNVAAPINLEVLQSGSHTQQPVPFPNGLSIQPDTPFLTPVVANESGTISEVFLPHVSRAITRQRTLLLTVLQQVGSDSHIVSRATLTGTFAPPVDQASAAQVFNLDIPVTLQIGQMYAIHISIADDITDPVDLCGLIKLPLNGADDPNAQVVEAPVDCKITPGKPYQVSFTNQFDGVLMNIIANHVQDVAPSTGPQTLNLTLSTAPDPASDQVLGQAAVTADFSTPDGSRGAGYTLQLDKSVPFVAGQTYFLNIKSTDPITLMGAAPINESSWDDGLPLRMDGYDGYSGLYQPGLNFEMYWDDNPDKLARFVNTLNQGDYIFMSSNRQWATITRVPERYPLSTAYYRALVGCPPGKDIIWCYNVAKPGQFQGQLGYELVKVFDSYPTLDIPYLGTLQINDQFAEEAFTVYDHPKVLIFKKSDTYDPAKVQAILGSVDLSHVVHLTPRRAGSYKDLMLPASRWAEQQLSGTWSQLFNYDWLQNRYPFLGLVIWYIFVFILGLATYPIIRLAFPGLSDRGYPLARALGLVLLAYFSWLAGSVGIPYSRVTIAVVFGGILVTGAVLGHLQRDELIHEFKTRKRYFLTVEGLFLLFFAFDLLIRLGNPDLWHPSKGGERPMDFSYFNAVLKSTGFPPFDPWFAGGYINYYYYGFVLVGTPVKLLGIVPSIAYNFILPTMFATVAISAFSVGWNFLGEKTDADEGGSSFFNPRLLAGIAAALLMVVLGNLGTIRMIFQGLQRLADPNAITANVNIFQRWVWAAQGFVASFKSGGLPFGPGDWYWFPSRVIPAPGDVEPITEFPFFTFLYSDMHAHMLVLPLTLLTIAWALSFVKARAKFAGRGAMILSFFVGAVVIGAIRPTNTWDFYTYLPLAALAVGYAVYRYTEIDRPRYGFSPAGQRLLLAVGSMLVLYLLSTLLYQPYLHWYAQGYGAVDRWKGSHTPIWSYLTHWGVFLFLIVCWMAWETREWLATTPVSALNKLKKHQLIIESATAAFLSILVYLAYLKVQIGWLALPLAAWAGILILRPGLSDAKRGVLFMVGTGLVLTIIVEVIVLRGDIGRMNTVFKLYLQAWTLFAISAAAAFGWVLPAIPSWLPRWRTFWQTGVTLLIAGAAMFTITATLDKVKDRMAPNAPHTLDAMTFMDYAKYWDAQDMDLSQDYQAIRWMQDNVQGSPVIVETNCPEYRWCSRFTIYTGLPGVVGWNWHQRQQRGSIVPSDWITGRIDEISNFYNTTDPAQAEAFLKKYNVKYIVVGQLEHIYYPGLGLDKFKTLDGVLWHQVYQIGETMIYEVNP